MNCRLVICLLSILASACSSENRSISAEIASQFEANTEANIDLRKIGPPTWDRLCILLPYSTSDVAEKVLGFKWDAAIGTNEGINVLVFIEGNKVVAYTTHSRDKGDFAEGGPKCIPRKNAVFLRIAKGNGNWVSLRPAN